MIYCALLYRGHHGPESQVLRYYLFSVLDLTAGNGGWIEEQQERKDMMR